MSTQKHKHAHFMAENYEDADGNPEGGFVAGLGISIKWHNDSAKRPGKRIGRNGVDFETVIDALMQRLVFVAQTSGGRWRGKEMASAMHSLKECRDSIEKAREKNAP